MFYRYPDNFFVDVIYSENVNLNQNSRNINNSIFDEESKEVKSENIDEMLLEETDPNDLRFRNLDDILKEIDEEYAKSKSRFI